MYKFSDNVTQAYDSRCQVPDTTFINYVYPTISIRNSTSKLFEIDLKEYPNDLYKGLIKGSIPDVFAVTYPYNSAASDIFSITRIHPSFFSPEQDLPIAHRRLKACTVSTGGHAYTYVNIDNQWYCVNDSNIHKVSEDDLKQQCNNPGLNFVLFYTKEK